MNKFTKYVYLSICEISVKRFRMSKFSTYYGYCSSMKASLLLKEFSTKEVSDLSAIGDYLKLIYNIEGIEVGEYIESYFNLNNIQDFYKCVQLIEEYYPLSHD